MPELIKLSKVSVNGTCSLPDELKKEKYVIFEKQNDGTITVRPNH
jgi:hypothetical protein